MNNIIPLFSSTSSLSQGGLFIVDKLGSQKSSGPINLVDLAKEEKLDKIHLVDSNFVNFYSCWKHFKDVAQFIFGLKLVVCADLNDKSEESIKSESKIVIFLKDDKDYKKIIKIYTKAATDGFYYYPRIDWKHLKELWGDGLILAFPYYSSYLARNTLSFSSIMPDFSFAKPVYLRECGQNHPFDQVLNLDNFENVQNVKSIYYKDKSWLRAFMVWRSVLSRSSFQKPNMDFLCSPNFSWENYKIL